MIFSWWRVFRWLVNLEAALQSIGWTRRTSQECNCCPRGCFDGPPQELEMEKRHHVKRDAHQNQFHSWFHLERPGTSHWTCWPCAWCWIVTKSALFLIIYNSLNYPSNLMASVMAPVTKGRVAKSSTTTCMQQNILKLIFPSVSAFVFLLKLPPVFLSQYTYVIFLDDEAVLKWQNWHWCTVFLSPVTSSNPPIYWIYKCFSRFLVVLTI